VINYLSGELIYFGIVKTHIVTSSIIFFTATTALLLPGFFRPYRQQQAKKIILRRVNSFPALDWIEVILLLWFALQFFRFLSAYGTTDKVTLISRFQTEHYAYLMIQLYVLSFFFHARNTASHRYVYYCNFASYILYCLLTGERDFIFLIISILLHLNLVRDGTLKRLAKLGIAIGSLGLLGTCLFLLRADRINENLFVSFLNQGSLLFVNTYVLDMLDRGLHHFYGQTYLNTFLNLLPHWIMSTDFNLGRWFRSEYVRYGESSYGFGLDAEAFLNFGFVGVVTIFFVIGSFQRFVFNRIQNKPFYLYFSVFFTAFCMYSFRNDSLALIKGSLYGILFFWMVKIFSAFLRRATCGASQPIKPPIDKKQVTI
jgi:oligosaccharide repeat unit polymerase